MRLIFRGDPLERERGGALSRQSITMEGVTFVLNEARDASSLSNRLKAKLRNNTHFEVVDEAAAPAEAPSAESAAVADEEEAAEAAAHAARAAKRKKG